MSGESHGRSPPAVDEAAAPPAARAADDPEGTDPEIEIDVDGGEPPARCPYCGRPFRRQRYETLHRGLDHPARLADRERAAFERLAHEEYGDVRRFRLYALGLVILVYFGMLFVYAFVT